MDNQQMMERWADVHSQEAFRLSDLRDAGIGFTFWPLHWWPWFRLDREDDRFGGRISLTLGPLVLHADYNAHDGPFGRPLATAIRATELAKGEE